jgi:hypothetical protein
LTEEWNRINEQLHYLSAGTLENTRSSLLAWVDQQGLQAEKTGYSSKDETGLPREELGWHTGSFHFYVLLKQRAAQETEVTAFLLPAFFPPPENPGAPEE